MTENENHLKLLFCIYGDRYTAVLSVMSDALSSLSMDVVLCPSPPAEIWAQQSAVYYLSHIGGQGAMAL